MPTVGELTAAYTNIMLAPRRGPGVCDTCFDLTTGPPRCRHCAHPDPHIDAVAVISYSVAHEQLHHALAAYKRAPRPTAERLQIGLAAVLWRYLAAHEGCLAQAAGVPEFEFVTTVPSSDRRRDENHPLRRIVGALVAQTRGRYQRALQRSTRTVAARMIDPDKFTVARQFDGSTVLLIDDTWTTGANARSAAAALKAAGAQTVAALVIGRHLNREWHDNERRLRALASPFDWNGCPHHRDV
jgi:predicted amidophosphoribosyltransferase